MKPYVKPELYYESFELAQHIAGCSITMHHTVEEHCKGDGTIEKQTFEGWFVTNDYCTYPYESYCYTNGAGTTVTVTS